SPGAARAARRTRLALAAGRDTDGVEGPDRRRAVPDAQGPDPEWQQESAGSPRARGPRSTRPGKLEPRTWTSAASDVARSICRGREDLDRPWRCVSRIVGDQDDAEHERSRNTRARRELGERRPGERNERRAGATCGRHRDVRRADAPTVERDRRVQEDLGSV